MNRTAHLIAVTEGRVPLDEVLGTGRFSLEQAEAQPGWLSVPRGEEESEIDEYGIGSFVYRAHRPMHPQRFAVAIEADESLFAGVLRSKGFLWIASIREEFVGEYGDRRQELVFIGNAMNEADIRRVLNSCLLYDSEYELGPQGWAEMEDPFPAIEFDTAENEPSVSVVEDIRV